MPERLSAEEAKTQDPSVNKQYDGESSSEKKFQDFYAIVDKLGVSLLGTYRNGVGPVHRSMAIAKRNGPDFLFLANANSQKFKDIDQNREVSVSFQNSSTQDWISITGEAVVTSNSDPRIAKIWSKGVSAWFGDLGDGVHDGGPEDPRMALIEVKPKYITYWQHEVGALGFVGEIASAVVTGQVANTGALREMKEAEIQQARGKDASSDL